MVFSYLDCPFGGILFANVRWDLLNCGLLALDLFFDGWECFIAELV